MRTFAFFDTFAKMTIGTARVKFAFFDTFDSAHVGNHSPTADAQRDVA